VPVGGKHWELRENSEDELGRASKSVSAETLVRKLRWATVGVQFDWSKVFRVVSISLMRVVGWAYLG
jgi:alkylated DNA repair protein alkB family protein 1